MTDDEMVAGLLEYTTDGVQKLFWRVKRQINGQGTADATVALAMVIASMRFDADDDADLLLGSLLAMVRRLEAARVEMEGLR